MKHVLKLTTNVNTEMQRYLREMVSLKQVHSKHVSVLMRRQHKASFSHSFVCVKERTGQILRILEDLIIL